MTPSASSFLVVRYALALGLICLFLVSSHSVSLIAIDRVEQRNLLISASANQKTLIDRIMTFAPTAVLLRNGRANALLLNEVDALEQTHETLLESARASPKLTRIYRTGGQGPALDPLIRKFIVDARLVGSSAATDADANAALRRMRSVVDTALTRVLRDANRAHQLTDQNQSEMLEMLQGATFLLALLALAGEAAFIFWPAHTAVQKSLRALAEKAERLGAAHARLTAQNAELLALRHAAEHDALHDSLTGLANRRGLEREIDRRRQAPHAAGLAVLHVDLDRFKDVNDTLGHAAGDFILREVAESLRRLGRGDDFIARIGGDEFLILRNWNADQAALESFAQRVVSQLNEPMRYQSEECNVGASVGVATDSAAINGLAAPEPHCDGYRLIADADIALYRAKRDGRGRCVFFCEALRREVEETKRLADGLTEALRDGQIQPVYQPQLDLRTGAICGVEALARWRHPRQGLLTPDMFLPVADRMGVTREIDRQILSAALGDLKGWDAEGLEIPRVAVNVSAARLRDAQGVAETLRSGAVPYGRISFEILESVLIDRIDDPLRHTLDLLQEAGVSLEIDDFGTGHASMMAMLTLAPAQLKIARELIAPLPDSKRHLAMVRSICDAAAALGVDVLAEGVETDAQAAMLRDLGCRRIQGFLVAAPMTSEDLTRFVAARRSQAESA